MPSRCSQRSTEMRVVFALRRSAIIWTCTIAFSASTARAEQMLTRANCRHCPRLTKNDVVLARRVVLDPQLAPEAASKRVVQATVGVDQWTLFTIGECKVKTVIKRAIIGQRDVKSVPE